MGNTAAFIAWHFDGETRQMGLLLLWERLHWPCAVPRRLHGMPLDLCPTVPGRVLPECNQHWQAADTLPHRPEPLCLKGLSWNSGQCILQCKEQLRHLILAQILQVGWGVYEVHRFNATGCPAGKYLAQC